MPTDPSIAGPCAIIVCVPLVSHITNKQSPIRAYFDRELGNVKPVCKVANAVLRDGGSGPPVAPIEGRDAGLVGLATEFIFAAVAGAVRRPSIGGASTPDLAHKRTQASRLVLTELDRLTSGSPLTGDALERAADCGLVCARLEQRFRMPGDYAIQIGLPDPADGEPEGLEGVIRATKASDETRADLVALLGPAIHDTRDLYRATDLHVNARFALSGALGGADADLIADGLLLDFKSTKDRSVIRSIDIYQLLGYTLADLQDWYGIHSVGIQALRWRTRWTIPVPELLRCLSGTTRSIEEWRECFASIFPEGARARAMRLERPHLCAGDRTVILPSSAEPS